VADGEGSVLEQLGTPPVGVDTGEVADVAAVRLEEADRRILALNSQSSLLVERVVNGRL
jgi:hypothetical protein